MTALAEDLITAKALIADPNAWCKGIDAKRCRLCAMYAAAKVAPYDLSGSRWAAMSDALKAAVPRKFQSEYGHRVVMFNDAETTSHADIMALFDRAIKKAQRAAA